jgi:hypothetical protein
MSANPYAPPTARVADLPGEPRRRSVIVMIVLTIVTFGIYYPVWFYLRRRELNAMNSPRKMLLWPLHAFMVLFIVEIGLAVATDDNPAQLIGSAGTAILAVVRLIVYGIMVFQCFVIKDIIEDHFSGPDDPDMRAIFAAQRVKLSGLATFFLSIYYLQYAINRQLAGRPGAAV